MPKPPTPRRALCPATLMTVQVDVTDSLPIPSDRTIGRDKAHGEIMVTSQRPAPFTLPKGATVRVRRRAEVRHRPGHGPPAAGAGSGRRHRRRPGTRATSRRGRSPGSTAAASTELTVTNQRADEWRHRSAGQGRDRGGSQCARGAAEEASPRQGLRAAPAEGRRRADAARSLGDGRSARNRNSTRTSGPKPSNSPGG